MKYNPNYDFSNKGIDWESYEKEARLRTDAVWERSKLKDFFRCFYKVFYWDPKSEKYYIMGPMHMFGKGTDGWRVREHDGYTTTGRTSSFQVARGWEFPARTISLNSADTIRDKNALCYYRFRAYKRCEGNSTLSRIMEIGNKDGPEKVDLACYNEMLEMTDYCSSNMLNWLSDLWHHMELHNNPIRLGHGDEIRMVPDEFDNPDTSVLTY
ncbi:hypothetical protein SteCoe_15802 [Stentor coeruleus]|uniref:Uncharacterized protein n=1 Tax=Stentor coeruleus TaxID=5963 RepID=A0A1R2B757_9CILI|nr:hypothetical protein SteCoe_28899 [Stentor coeruleus]OMJ83278.1 hypothetical protein SteCoe_15802 [Stentor coeruleus]